MRNLLRRGQVFRLMFCCGTTKCPKNKLKEGFESIWGPIIIRNYFAGLLTLQPTLA